MQGLVPNFQVPAVGHAGLGALLCKALETSHAATTTPAERCFPSWQSRFFIFLCFSRWGRGGDQIVNPQGLNLVPDSCAVTTSC